MQWIDQEEEVPMVEASTVSEEDKTYTQTQLGVSNSTLSCERKISKDTFMFYFDWLVQFAKELPLNKRSVLKVITKLYDPLGLISPVYITVKVLFQDLCKLKISWDEPLNEELALGYSSWLSDLLKVQCIAVERCYLPNLEETFLFIYLFIYFFWGAG